MARACIIVGLPFPNIMDPKIILREEYYLAPSQRMAWMRAETIRAVN